MTATPATSDLDTHYSLSETQISLFREHGFIMLQNVFSKELLNAYGAAITDCVIEHNDLADVPMHERDTYQKAFIQVTNLWRKREVIRKFVFGKRLAWIATELLEVSGVRLYHDQALYKEPGGGFTPWHADQQYWPLATDRTITAWVPLQPVPIEMGPLSFAAGSQHMTYGRDLEISDASEQQLADALERSDYSYFDQPFNLGDVSFHLGWTYHKAGANTTDHPRRVMTVIYMDEHMMLKNPENPNQQRDWDAWCPEAQVGQVIDTPLNPVVFSQEDPIGKHSG